MKKPNAPSGFVTFDLDLEFHNQPPHSQSGKAGPVPDLFKTNKIIEDQVLLLPFEKGFGDTAYDQSIYQNHAELVNVVWYGDNQNKYVNISESGSYLRIYSNPVLNGTHGIKISARIYMSYDITTSRDRIIIDKHNINGGYTLGVGQDGRPFFRIRQNLQMTELISDSVLTADKWYTIRAGFSANPASLTIHEKTDSSGVSGLLPFTYAPLIIGAENLAGLYTNNFYGLIDDVSITTSVDYVDFDLIRVAVIDANQLINRDSLRTVDVSNLWEFHRFDFWLDYTSDRDSILYNYTGDKPPNWTDMRQVWDEYFKVLNEQNLVIKGGFAEGTLNGIEGLNLLMVGALRNGILLYYGEGFVIGINDKNTSAHIDLYPPEY